MTEPRAASTLDRMLRWFADVRPGEGFTASMLALNVFLILTAYYVLKPIREALILSEGSPELKTYMSLGQVGLLIFAVPWYGKLAGRLPRGRLINTVTWFFIGCLAVFYLTGQSGIPIGIPYFLWIGVFNLMIVAQFWSFANDIYSRPEGERLFPLIGFGASAGAVIGALIAARLINMLGVYQLFIVGGAILAAQLQITNYVDRNTERHAEQEKEPDKPTGSSRNAFGLVLRTPYLLLMALMLMVLSTVDAVGEYVLASIVKSDAEATLAAGTSAGATIEGIIGGFYSQYYALVNVTSLVLQLFIVSRLIKWLSVRHAVSVYPFLSVCAYTALAFAPWLSVVLFAKVTEKGVDYSLGNTVRNMLFLPCTQEEKYAGKQAIDSFFYRTGDVLSAALVFIGSIIAMSARGFAIINVGLAAVMLLLSVLVGRAYVAKTKGPSALPTPTPAPQRQRERRLTRRVVPGAAAVLMALGLSSPAAGQNTRAEAIAEQQAEKAKDLRPYVPNTFEKITEEMKRRFLEGSGGFFPYFSSVHPGGSLTLGAGYRQFYSPTAAWEVKGLYSIKNYKMIELSTIATSFFDDRVTLGARIGWRDATQVGFYGLGMDTLEDDRANFRYREGYGGGYASARLAGPFRVSGGLTYEDYRLTQGQGSAPSIETVFSPAEAPGLGDNPAYLHTEVTTAVDTRRSPGYSRTGGYYRLTLHDYNDIDGALSFNTLTGEAIKHIPVLRETWVISLRGRVVGVLDGDDVVPYFLTPALGGGSSLRAFSTARFTDRHSMLMTAEWRWIPNRLGLDMAIFFDAGKVTQRFDDLDFNDLKTNGGFGIRFHGPTSTPLRIDVARGSEGLHIVFSGNAPF